MEQKPNSGLKLAHLQREAATQPAEDAAGVAAGRREAGLEGRSWEPGAAAVACDLQPNLQSGDV